MDDESRTAFREAENVFVTVPISAGIASLSIPRKAVARTSAGAALAGEVHVTLVSVNTNATAKAVSLIPGLCFCSLFTFIFYVPSFTPKVAA